MIGINYDVIQVDNNKHIEFFNKNLINLTLKAGQNVKKIKKYHLVFKIAISSSESHLSLIVFFYFYLMMSVG